MLRCSSHDDSAKLFFSTAKILFQAFWIVSLIQYFPAALAQSTSANGSETSAIVWGPCNNSELIQLGAQCGFLDVPLSYSNPDGEKIQIALSRLKSNASGNAYQGIMLVNPGGPGGSGLTLITMSRRVPGTTAQTYDWIGFDPRGVGSSRPALSCDPSYTLGPRPNYMPTSLARETVWLARARNYANACVRRNGNLLRHVTSFDTVQDMEMIRLALGQERINYYGLSYGTYLGQLYATRYPNRVRRMVLDSNIDPERIWFEHALDQARAFERNVQLWFEWLAQYNDTYKLGRTKYEVEATWNAVLADLQENPINETFSSFEWLDMFVGVVYSQTGWSTYGQIFSDWVYGRNGDQVVTYYQNTNSPGNDNSLAAYLAVQTSDTLWPQSWSFVRLRNWFIYPSAPTFTWYKAWSTAPSLYWPLPAERPLTINGEDVGRVLIVGETLDAATPFVNSIAVRRRFPRSSLIAVIDGTSHAETLSGNPCVDNIIAAYLATGQVPPRQNGDGADISCPPLPKPTPSRRNATAKERVRRQLQLQRFWR